MTKREFMSLKRDDRVRTDDGEFRVLSRKNSKKFGRLVYLTGDAGPRWLDEESAEFAWKM